MSKKVSKDSLGDRMKTYYEDRTRLYLPRKCYAILRIDGKAFHTYTKGLERPFDDGLIEDMDATAAYLCKNIMGAKCAYVQSDEISIVITDFDSITTQAWFDYNVQKMVSISASMATAKFLELRFKRGITKLAMFDSRAFSMPQRIEVINYLKWRQQDATRNSISSVAQSLYSHKQLEGVSSDEQQELIFQKGINWNDFPSRKKRGGLIIKQSYMKGEVERTRWESVDTPIFTKDSEILSVIPPYEPTPTLVQ